MADVEILCLANSKKHGGRCVAGIRTDGGGWVRPVAPSGDGALHPNHYLLPDGTEPRLFDLLKIEVTAPAPKPHQPENWLIGSRRWQLLARPSPGIASLLAACGESGPVLLGSLSDRVSYDEFLRQPARSSLAMVVPKDLKWHLVPHLGRGIIQVRAHFMLGNATYDLVVTDPLCLEQLEGLAAGLYPLEAAGLTAGDMPLLTISLGEPYDGHCYKLVAAVASVPAARPSEATSLSSLPPKSEESHGHSRVAVDVHLAEFVRTRGPGLGRSLVEAFSLSTASRETEDEAVQRLRAVLEEAFGEGLGETACD